MGIFMLDSHWKRRNNGANATRGEIYMRSKLLTFCCSSCMIHQARFCFAKQSKPRSLQTVTAVEVELDEVESITGGPPPKI